MVPLTIFIGCLLLFIIFVLYMKSYLRNFEGFTNSFNKNNILDSEHFNNYISSISPDMKLIKLPNYTGRDFKLEYINSISTIPNKYLAFINQSIYDVDKYVNLLDITVFQLLPWKIAISTNNLELSMPYTLDNTIIIPHQLLESEYNNYLNNGAVSKRFITILIHEKIHIIQRKFQIRFNHFYNQYYTFMEKYDGAIPDSLNKRYMTNPDSNNNYWIYKYKQNKYLPLLVYNQNNISEIGYNINQLNDTILLNKVELSAKINKRGSLYHPNEIFACAVSHQIINKQIKPDILLFLQSVKPY